MMSFLARLLGSVLAFLVVVALGAAPAAALTKVSIGNVEVDGTSVTGVLTFRSPEVVEVDPHSLVAKVDGQAREVVASESSSIKRTSMLVIDTSGSMGADGMRTVRSATKAYLAEAPKDVRVGVATFADTAGVDQAPTADRGRVQRVVDGLVSYGDTSLYAGVIAAAKAIGDEGDRSIVLLSDGADTISKARTSDRKKATKALRDRGIRVDVVRFNTDDPDATTALQGFARAGGGSVISAADAREVGRAFEGSARALQSQSSFEITTPEPLVGSHVIRLEGTAGGEPFVVEQRFDLGAGAGPAAVAPTLDPGDGALGQIAAPGMTSSLWPWLGALSLGLAISLFAYGMLTPTLLTRRERRLAAIDAYVVPGLATRADARAPSTPLREQLVAFGERTMHGRRSTTRTMELINRADLPLRAGEWFVIRLGAGLGGLVLGYVLVPGPWWLGVAVGLVMGVGLPQLVLRYLAARRAKAFERVLPQSLMLVATSLRSGFGLPQALSAVAQDSAPPVDREFSRALAETRIGTDIADTLERMADRMGSDAMHMAVTAIRIQREVGGNLAETLETTARTLLERETLHRQVAALSAEGRLSAQILIGLPIVLFIYMLFVNYDYVQLLWTTALGLLMSTGAIVLMLVGVVWMRRVIRIEV
ncbi:type II secretion system F family protein [Janibacter terrae]|uniref:type II secretion system F family protein n=1 Tax=Janibacter terrae TaxID=103817 RepID=UPI003812A5ED